jgi:uncharacterized repeat protein (TIGR03803 family)
VVLQNNSRDSITVTFNSTFTFATPLTVGSAYQVSVLAQPSGQSCTVGAGTGSIASSNVTNVVVTCVPITRTVGGTVSGLADGVSIVLQDNGADSLTVSSNSAFTFATAVAVGSSYSVSIGTQPPYQGCTVSSGSGTVANADVTNVVVHCPLVQVLWNFGFGTDGEYPLGTLIFGSDGNLYGTTEFGGDSIFGTLFKVTSDGAVSVFSSFAGGSEGSDVEGGVNQGTDGNFYGTTYEGGADNLGTVFKVTPSGVITTLWSFGAGADGQLPLSGLVQGKDGNFYGTTGSGGSTGYGTVFKVTPAGVETILWNFGTGMDGFFPQAGLIQGSDGNFYGTTSLGGTNGRGTVYKVTPNGTETVLWNFDFVTGTEPMGSLTQGIDGNFYGTVAGGGSIGGGTVFKITPDGMLTVLYNFGNVPDGSDPWVGLVRGSDGNFYGTTISGGTINNSGTIFKVTPDGAETVLWDFGFGGNGGFTTISALVQGPDGNFYGTTNGQGTAGRGTLFKLIP